MRMPAAFRRVSHGDRGFTLTELSVSMMVSALVLASMASVVYAFSKAAHDSGRNADLQREVRATVAEMVVELRQAEAVRANGSPIESLGSGRIAFYTDREETEGPERVVYERRDCVDGVCELWVSRYPAVAGSGPSWEFAAIPMEDSILIHRLMEAPALFRGLEWAGDPLARSYVASCDESSGPSCDFPLVAIVVQARPVGTTDAGDTLFEVVEEVRLRNEAG